MPKISGEWGLLDLRAFGKALLCKSLWRGIFGEGRWSITIKKKYMKGKDMEQQFRIGRIEATYGSAIWLSFRKIEQYFLKNLKWSLQSGSRIIIGIDPILSSWESISIPERLLIFFHRNGIFMWDKLIIAWQGPLPLWKEAIDLGMSESLAKHWNTVKDALRSYSFHRSRPEDYLIWRVPKENLQVRVKDIYTDLIGLKTMHSCPKYPQVFQKSGCPPKLIYFSSLVFHNKNMSWENLKKRNWHGPSRCTMCESAEESNYHMFFQCQSTQQIWHDLAILYGFPLVFHASTHATFEWWSGQRDSWRSIIIIVLWCAWRWRNNKIFKEIKNPLKTILQHIISIYDSMPKKQPKTKNGNINEQEINLLGTPRAFFDGAEQ